MFVSIQRPKSGVCCLCAADVDYVQRPLAQSLFAKGCPSLALGTDRFQAKGHVLKEPWKKAQGFQYTVKVHAKSPLEQRRDLFKRFREHDLVKSNSSETARAMSVRQPPVFLVHLFIKKSFEWLGILHRCAIQSQIRSKDRKACKAERQDWSSTQKLEDAIHLSSSWPNTRHFLSMGCSEIVFLK